ncbi:uncharacterized protein LOC144719731 isoform X2 [Lampetra planeri]
MNIPQAIPSVLLLLLHSACCSSRVLQWNVSNTSSAGHMDVEAVTTPQMHSDLWISPRVMLDEVQMLDWRATPKELLPVSAHLEVVISKCGRVVEQKTDVDILEIFITVMYVGGSYLFPDKGRILQVRDNIRGLKLLQPKQHTSASQDYQEFDIDLSNRNVTAVSYMATLDPALAIDGVNISLAASVIRTQFGTEAEIATSTLFIMQVAKFKTTPHHGLHFVGFVVAFVMVGLAVVCISLLRQNKCWGVCSKSTQTTQLGVQSACSESVCAGEGQTTSAMASLPMERLESEELCRERKEAVDMLTHAILETFGNTAQPIRCLDLQNIESPVQAYGFLSQLIEKFDIPRDAVQHALRLLLPLHSMKQLQELLRLVDPNTCSVPIRVSAVGVHEEGVDVAAFPVAAGLVEHVRASLLASCRQNAKVNSPRMKQRTLKEAKLQPAKLVSPRHSRNSDMSLQPSQLKSSEPSLEGETLMLDSSGTQERIFVFRSQPEEESNAVVFNKKKKRNFLNYKSSKIMDVAM